MPRVNRCTLFAAALAALGIIVGGGREAKAELSKLAVSRGGIVVVAGSGSGTDPAYTFQFDAGLTGTLNAYSPFSHTSPTSITVDNLVGVYPFDTTGTGPPGWLYSIQVVGLPNFFYPYFTSDVTWTYLGTNSVSAPANSTLDLGIFSITTASNLPGNYGRGVLPTTISYSYSIDGGGSQGGSGTGAVSLQQGGIQAVPEPSTLIAPVMAVLGLGVVRLLKRRKLRGLQTG